MATLISGERPRRPRPLTLQPPGDEPNEVIVEPRRNTGSFLAALAGRTATLAAFGLLFYWLARSATRKTPRAGHAVRTRTTMGGRAIATDPGRGDVDRAGYPGVRRSGRRGRTGPRIGRQGVRQGDRRQPDRHGDHRRAGPPRHTHTREDESFYVLTGGLQVECGEDRFEAGPGSFVFLPRNLPHTFRSIGDPVTALLIVTPGGLDEYFAELHAALDTGGGPAEIAKVQEEYGIIRA
jgi:mannose-6-phosphate isomerase-like protein (cupin superfamily)